MSRRESEAGDALVRVLGHYEHGGQAHVALPSHRGGSFVGSTVIHETTHRMLVESTCFGILQIIIAAALGRLAERSRLRERLEEALSLTARESQRVQEGVATFRQIEYIKNRFGSEPALAYLALKPELYRGATVAFDDAVRELDLASVPRDIVAYAIAEWTMNTDVLALAPSLLDHSVDFPKALRRFSPDRRLDSLVSRMTNDRVQQTAAQEVDRWLNDRSLRHRAEAAGLTERIPSWAVYKALHACVGPVYGEGDPFAFRTAAAEAIEAFQNAAIERDQPAIADLPIRAATDVEELREAQHDAVFEPEVPSKGSYAAFDHCFDVSQALHTFQGIDADALIHVHLFKPEAPSAPPLVAKPGEEVVTITAYYGEPPALDDTIISFRVKRADLPSIIAQAATIRRLAVVIAAESIAGPGADAQSRAPVVTAIMSTLPVFQYSRRDVLEQVKTVWKDWASHGLTVRVAAFRDETNDWTMLAIVAETERLVWVLLIGEAAVLYLKQWAMRVTGEWNVMSPGEFDRAIGGDRFIITVDHYRRFGY